MKLKIEKVVGYLTEKSPTIFTGLAVGSAIGSVVLAVKATPKAIILLEEREREVASVKKDEGGVKVLQLKELSKKEIVKTTWKCYIPTAATLSLSIFCIIMAHRTHARKNAALAAALSVSEQALQTFTKKSIERIGEKKTEEIKAAAIEETVANNPPTDYNTEHTGKGDVLFYLPMNGRYFYSDIESVRKAINDFNFDLRDEMEKSLNELFYNLGVTPDVLGNCVGWNINYKGPIDYSLPAVKAKDGKPCLALELYNWDCEFRDYVGGAK